MFCTWKAVSNDVKNIKQRIDDFKVFKEELEKMKPYVTWHRITFHCGSMNWTLLLKITKTSSSEENHIIG